MTIPPPRSPALELLVEQVSRAIASARRRHGDAAVRERVAEAISPEDAEVAIRVLRALGRELGDAPVDLDALDARLRGIAGSPRGAGRDRAERTPEPGRGDGREADGTRREASAPGERADADRPRRPTPPTGLRSTLRGGRPR